MKFRTAAILTACIIIPICMIVSGCFFFNPGNAGPSPTPMNTPAPGATATPLPPAGTPTRWPGGSGPTQTPSGTVIPTQAPPVNGSQPINGTPSSPTPSPTAGEPPVISAQLTDWGTDRDTYARGDTATGRVNVTNTGNVPIDKIDFTIVIRRTIFFVPVEKTFSYSATGLDIQPGVKQRVQFSQTIPADYSGISTAGDYRYVVTASLAGKNVGSYSRNIKVV